jgi:hypothetical protein
MRGLIVSFILFVIHITSAYSQTYISPGEVFGLWGIDGSPYYIQGDILIPNDSTLIIEPGVLVEFQGHYGLYVRGRLLTIGTEENNVTFTIHDTTGLHNYASTSGGWKGIRFIDTMVENDTSKIIYCNLQYGKAVGTEQFSDAGGVLCIINFDKVIISNSVMSHCSASGTDHAVGGALAVGWSDIQLIGNVFSNNIADAGGAIYIYESDPILIDNVVENNYARYGGAIDVQTKSHPIFIDNHIINNSSSEAGGAISIGGDSVVATFHECILSGNSSHFGGAINAWNAELQFTNCKLTDNAAHWIGGGIHADYSTIEINNTYFEYDTAYVFGGAMGVYYSDVCITDSRLTDNSARVLGGGIHSDYGNINIINTTFERDTSGQRGGGISIWQGELKVENSEVIHNTAVYDGGAICSDSSTVVINNSSFMLNVAMNNGGAINIDRGSIALKQSEFAQNASQWGGAISTGSSAIEVRDCLFNENASEHGGALCVGYSNAVLHNVSFVQNTSIWGGGISSTNCDVVIDSCLFIQNTVTGEAGALEYIVDSLQYNKQLTVHITDSEFIDNISSNYYGSVKIMQTNSVLPLFTVRMDKNVFRGNRANSIAALRFIGNIEDILVTNSIFDNNHTTTNTSIFNASQGARVKVYNVLFCNNYPRAASLNIGARIDFINCTFVNNNGSTNSGLGIRNNSEALVMNSIFWGNGTKPIQLVTVDANGNAVTVIHSDIQFGPDSISVSDSLSIVNWSVGNITADPLFVDPGNNQYGLNERSPCISAGIDSIEFAGRWYYAPLIDIEGNRRPYPVGTMPDMGAYESDYLVNIVNENYHLPQNYSLYQNYPNPCNPSTTISWQIPEANNVTLKIFDILGREVATLVDESRIVGRYDTEFEASSLPSGVYIYRLQAGEYVESKKMLLLK